MLTDDQLIEKLKKVGLPIYGEREDWIHRLERNGFLPKSTPIVTPSKGEFEGTLQALEEEIDEVENADKPRRGRPPKVKDE